MASPATINLVCNSGAAETETTVTAGIDFVTVDNCLNTSGNRTTYPITIPANATPAYSYEKWLNFQVGATAPDTQVTNFKFWGSGAAIDSGYIVDYYKVTATYVQPALPTGTSGFTTVLTATSAAKVSIPGTLTTTGDDTDYIVMFLQVAQTASQGNMTQQTYNYSYDEN